MANFPTSGYHPNKVTLTVTRSDDAGNRIGLRFTFDWTNFDNQLTEDQIITALLYFETQTSNWLANLQPTWTESKNHVWEGELNN